MADVSPKTFISVMGAKKEKEKQFIFHFSHEFSPFLDILNWAEIWV